MKKLLLIAFLMLALVITAVACTGGDTTDDTTVGDTTVETPTEAPTDEPDEPDDPTEAPTDEPEDPTDVPTEAPTDEPEVPTEKPTEAPTEEPTADPAEPVLMLNPEDLNTLAGAGAPNVNQLGSSEVITEGDDTFVRWTAAGGDPYVALIPLGSNYTLPQYMAIRYRTNSAVEGQFFVGSGAGWTGSGDSFMVTWTEGDWSFVIVDLTQTGVTSITDGLLTYARMDFFAGDSAEGDYFDIAYVGVFNTAEYAMAYDFEQYPPYIEADDAAAGKVAHSFDTFYVNGQMYFPEDGGAGDKLTAQDNIVAFAAGEKHDSMILRGWVGFNQPIDSFGYFLDNYDMVFNPDYTKPTEDGVKAAGGEHASRFEILVPLAHLVANDHFAGFVVKLADGTIVRLRADITVDLPDDIADTFVSNVASNEDGTDLQASDLSNYFTVTYGAGEPHNVTGGVYQYGGINELYASVDGLYAFSINMLESANTAMAFVRGTRVVHSVDLPAVDGGLYPINNYYETDGQGRMGGAGIYAAIYNGRLNLMIKAYDDETRTHQINRDYSIVAEGTTLTIADNGSTIYFLVDGNLLATVALSGSTSYEKICDLAEGITFAQTAVVTLADGTTDTIENTLVVATIQSQLGIAVRPATIKFDSIKVEGLSSVTIPADFYVPEVKENLALNKPVDADSVENENNIPANATDGDDSTRWGALPNGAANLIVDLEEVKALTGMDVLFENAGWNYEIAISEDGVDYTVIHTSEAHGGKMLKLEGEVNARYIKFSRLDDSADTSTPHWFSIYEVYVYGKAEETETPDTSIAVDGDFADWADKAVTEIPVSKFIAWTGSAPENFTLKTSFSSDGEYLYVYLNPGENSGVTMYQICLITDNTVASDAAQAWYNVTFADGAAAIAGVSGACKGEAKVSMTGTEVEAAIPIAAIYGEGFALPVETRILLVAQINGDTHMGTFHDGKNPNDDGWADRTGDGCPLTLNADGSYTFDLPQTEEPETPVVENLTIDLTAVTPETGANFMSSWTDAGFNAPIIQMMNWGSSIKLGEIDLSKYSAVVVTYGSDPGAKQGDVGTFMALTKNGAVENADSSDKTDAEIIAQATMSNATGFWNVTRDVTIEFDTDYNGVVYLAQDMKDGNGIAIASIVFIAK